MTNKTNKTERKNLIPPHGGYRKLLSYQMAEIVYDLTKVFCDSYMTYKTNKSYRTYDQMFQAARSGKQNIAEKTELKLVGVARASLEELLQDYLDFLRHREMAVWQREDPRVREIRGLAYKTNKSYRTYMSYMSNPEPAANCMICLIHQANYLLDQQIRRLEKDFLENGGFTERLYRERRNYRG